MQRPIKLLLGLAAAVTLAAMVALGPAALAGTANVLEFDTMTPVTGPFVAQSAFNCPNAGTATIRDLTGGGLPWVVQRAKGDLRGDGSLKIEVTGLVLADQPCVPAGAGVQGPRELSEHRRRGQRGDGGHRHRHLPGQPAGRCRHRGHGLPAQALPGADRLRDQSGEPVVRDHRHVGAPGAGAGVAARQPRPGVSPIVYQPRAVRLPSDLNPRVRPGIWCARRTRRALPACGPRLRTLRVRALRSSPAPSPRPSIAPAARPLLTDPGQRLGL